MKKLRATCILLSAMVASSNIVWASNYKDTEGHWAESAISTWSDKNVLIGYDDLFRPDEMITRGEMAVILDKMMYYTETQENTFADLDEEDFYTESILKSAKAGTFVTTDDNLARPKDNMTRQEAIVTLAKALGITPVEEGSTGFTDDEQIADWAKGYVLGMSQKGYLNKKFFDKEFRPDESISRAEVAMLLDDSIDDLITEDTIAPKEDNSSDGKNVIINTPDVKLENSVIDNDLILAEGIGEGDVELNNVTIKGTLIVRGGGIHTVKLHNSKVKGLSVEKKSAPVRILTQGSTVETTNVKTPSILEGTFKNVTVSSPVDLTVRGSIDNVEVAAKATLNAEGTIKNVNITEAGKDTVVTGNGSVENVEISAENVSVKTPNSNVTISGNVSSAMVGDKTISGGNSSKTSSSGKNSSSSNNRRPVSSLPNTPSKPSEPEKPSEPTPPEPSEPTEISINSVEYNTTYSSGTVKIVLSEATKTPLEKEDFYIHCTGAGKNMTILDVTTTDNKVYTLTTTYYNDNTYNVQVTIDGKMIEKHFTVRSDCAELKDAKTKRISDTTAEFQYLSDSSGTLYYTVVAKETVLAAYVDENTAVLAESSSEPTEEDLIESGTAVDMAGTLNKVTIEGLKANTAYTIYFVGKDKQDRVTPVKQVDISAEALPPAIEGQYKIENIKVNYNEKAGLWEEKYWFTVTFDQPLKEELALENFTLTCPQQAGLHLGRAAKVDDTTYDVYMKANYIPNDGNTLTMHVTFADGTEVTEDFRFDTRLPDVSPNLDVTIERVDDTHVNISINNHGNREGYIYYKLYPNDAYDFTNNTESKSADDVYAHGTKERLGTGLNVFENVAAIEDQRFCFALENEEGVHQAYLSFCNKTIGEYGFVTEEPDDPDKLEITNVEVEYNDYYGQQLIYVTFSKKIEPGYDVSTSDNRIQISGLTGRPSFMLEPYGASETITDEEGYEFTIYEGVRLNFNDRTMRIEPGEHNLTITTADYQVLTAKFVIGDDYQTAGAATASIAAEPAMLNVEAPATDDSNKIEIEESATDDINKTEVEAPTTDDTDKTEAEAPTTDNTDKTESEESTTDDADKTESEKSTTDDADKTESEESTTDDADKTESEKSTTDDADKTEVEESTTDDTDKTEVEESTTDDADKTEVEAPADDSDKIVTDNIDKTE